VDESDERAVRETYRDVVEGGASSLLALSSFGDEPRAELDGREIADGHVQRDRRLTVGVAGGSEGNVGQ
jgi:hypothetical protein